MAARDRPSVRTILRNDEKGRLRTPWRLLLAALTVFLVGAGGTAIAAPVEGAAVDATDPTPSAVVGTVAQVTPLAFGVAGILVASRLIDRRTPRDLGLERSRAWWTDLGVGLGLGTALPLVVLVSLTAAGYASVTGTLVTRSDPSLPVAPAVSPLLAFVLVVCYFVAVGVFEELLFRGYLLVNIAEGLRWFDAVDARGALAGATVVTSVLFGLGHGANPSATGLAVALIACYGALLAASVLLTGRIAVAVGLHVAWNVAVSSVVGFPVSGFTTPVTLVDVDVSGPALVTGGAFGPEGGLVSLVSLAVGAAGLAWWARRRDGDATVRTGVATPEQVDRGRPDAGRRDDGEPSDAE